ncbi:hypothetical protein PV05_07361 [Exophiala xenobiotica]|uniref:Uncharacterized protein n=1 Tax=Exophiala xenobiotica TaxID=348802 RepID=A0A0D2F5B6_9EURO|nr:uncharacterized protein PV05_07361 [Exophiala xenobiotica]KIW55044.1 hypothetical protein PV05_07361 [Exophiala xenobiotica]
MDTSEKGSRPPAHKPPFPRTSSLIARKDLILPAAFNDMSPLARELLPLRIEERNEVQRFLCAFLDISRFNSIRKMLWLIGVPGAPRSLYYQKLLRREIVIAERLDLHLVWAKSRIFIKPLPDFLLNYEFWENHISCEPQLHRAACGLLYSYCGLIRFGHDLQLAQENHLINENLDYRAWTEFTRTILSILDHNDFDTMEKRFRYGELRLNRLDVIYRYSPQEFSVSSMLQGFPHALTESYVPYMDQYNNAVSAFGVIVIILSAFNLSLSAHSKSPDPDLQQAAYGFAVFAMILCALVTGLFIVLPTARYTWQNLTDGKLTTKSDADSLDSENYVVITAQYPSPEDPPACTERKELLLYLLGRHWVLHIENGKWVSFVQKPTFTPPPSLFHEPEVHATSVEKKIHIVY